MGLAHLRMPGLAQGAPMVAALMLFGAWFWNVMVKKVTIHGG